MLDKDTLAQLSKAEAIAQARTSIEEAPKDCRPVALPEDFKLHDMEPYLVNRRRARGTMTTQALPDFVAYLKAHAEPGATVFVSPDDITATAVLNLGTPKQPGHTDNRAVYDPPILAAFTAMLAVCDVSLDQQKAAEWLEDWMGMWDAHHDAEKLTPPATIAAIRKVTIEALSKAETSAGQLSAEKSTFEQVKATSGANKLPTHIYFKCAPYLGIDERTYILRLGIRTGGKDPVLTLRIVNKEQHAEQIGQELTQKVRDAVGDALPVHLGKYIAK